MEDVLSLSARAVAFRPTQVSVTEQQQGGVKAYGAISMAAKKTASQPQIPFLQVLFK